MHKTLRPPMKVFLLAELLLVFRVTLLITPCSSEMQLDAAAFYQCRKCKQSLWSKAGLHLAIRRVAPWKKAEGISSSPFCALFNCPDYHMLLFLVMVCRSFVGPC